MRLASTIRFLAATAAVAFAASADEPVWPADFADKLAANIAAAQPGAGQTDTTAGSIAVVMRSWGVDESAGYGTPEDPFDSIWRSIAFSDFGILNTKKPRGIAINFR